MGINKELRDLARAARGERPASNWTSRLAPDYVPYRVGRAGSMNHGRMANATMAVISRDQAVKSASWFSGLLALEEVGAVVQRDGMELAGFFTGYEPCSRNYLHVNWAPEALMLQICGQQQGNVFTEAAERLRRNLRRYAAFAALAGVPRMIKRAKNGRTLYDGPATLLTGPRSNPLHHEHHPADHVFARALGEPPRVERPAAELIVPVVAPLADSCWAVSPQDRQAMRSVIRNENDPAMIRHLVGMLAGARTVSPYEIRRYSGTVVTMLQFNTNGNTSCTYGTMCPTTDPVESSLATFLHPYGDNVRVRGGTPKGRFYLGAGGGWLEHRGGDTFFVCENLTDQELADRRAAGLAQAEQFRLEMKLPAGPPVFTVRVGPQHDPELNFGGGV